MQPILVVKKFARITDDERKLLRNLTVAKEYGGYSWMNSILLYRRHKTLAILARLNNEFVGWAVMSKMGIADPYIHISVYVSPEHRRKGIGKAIINRAKKLKKQYWSKLKFDVQPWDRRGRFFYKNTLGKKILLC